MPQRSPGLGGGGGGGVGGFYWTPSLLTHPFSVNLLQLKLSTFKGEKVGDKWNLDVKAEYEVITGGVQNVLFQVCPNLLPPEEVSPTLWTI